MKNDSYPNIYHHAYYFYLVNFLASKAKKPTRMHMLLH